jgi:transposase
MVDALGNPLAFFLTPGQAHDLEGADALLPQMKADTVLADKAFDADERVIEPLLAAGKTPVIPSRSTRKTPRDFDKELYKARHSIATRYDKTARNFLAAIHRRLSACDLPCNSFSTTRREPGILVHLGELSGRERPARPRSTGADHRGAHAQQQW